MKKQKLLLILLLTLTLIVSFSATVAAEPTEDWIIQFDTANYSGAEIEDVAAEYDLKYLLDGYYITDGDTAKRLEPLAMVASVAASGTATLCDVEPSGSLYNDPDVDKQWGLQAVSAEKCWRYYTKGSRDVVVCVIDSGFDTSHEDAQGKNFVYGKDYVMGGNVTSDCTSHGTSCAGLIGATTNNGVGITGLLKDVTVVNQRTFYWDNDAGVKKSKISDVVEAIRDAVDLYHADVISMSFLFAPQSEDEMVSFDMLKAACEYAAENGVILVAAAGNNGNSGSALQYPAAYDCVIGVGAVKALENGAGYAVSDFSAKNQSVFCSAPGENIYTLGNRWNQESLNNKYRFTSGTSLATPYVASLGALARSFDSEITREEFASLLKTTSTDLGDSGYDTSYGYGLVNYEKLLKAMSDKKDGNIFSDISRENWYYQSVMNVYHKNLMVGVGKTTFAPETDLTRGMFVTILYRMDGEPAVTGENTFTDVPEEEYYRDAVVWGKNNGVVYGVGESQFAPTNPISRQEVVTMLYRYYEDYKKIELPDKGIATDFVDAGEIEDYAKTAVVAMVKAGILNGYEVGSGQYVFRPKTIATRAVAAQIISGLSALE